MIKRGAENFFLKKSTSSASDQTSLSGVLESTSYASKKLSEQKRFGKVKKECFWTFERRFIEWCLKHSSTYDNSYKFLAQIANETARNQKKNIILEGQLPQFDLAF